MIARTVTDAEIGQAIATYRAEGYARIPRVASHETLVALRTRATEIMAGTITYPGLFFQPDTPTGRYDDLQFGQGWQGPDTHYRKIEKLELDPVFRAWLENDTFQHIIRCVIPGRVSIYRAVLFAKAAHAGSDLPWHQDAGRFWGLDRDPEIQLWTALDDAPIEAGCVEVLPGSHHHGLATPLGGVVPRANVGAAGADARAVAIPARAGDLLLLHNHLWHRSGANTTAFPRRGFTVCYMPAETHCLRKKRAPRQFVEVFRRSDG